jgi:hypothetical protein
VVKFLVLFLLGTQHSELGTSLAFIAAWGICAQSTQRQIAPMFPPISRQHGGAPRISRR